MTRRCCILCLLLGLILAGMGWQAWRNHKAAVEIRDRLHQLGIDVLRKDL